MKKIISLALAMSLCIMFCACSDSPKSNNTQSSNESNTTIDLDSESSQENGVNFSLDQYTDHGDLSCGLIWCSKNVWSDELDMNIEQFAYFDAEGKQVSDWFDCQKYVPVDFANDFVIIYENTENKKSSEKREEYNYVYNLDFSNIAVIRINKTTNREDISVRFNEDGYAFTNGEIIESNGMSFTYPDNGYYDKLAYIDKAGAHLFDDGVEFIYNHSADIDNDIFCEKDYIIVSDRFVCNKEGKLLVDVQKAVEASGLLENYYTFDLDDLKDLSINEKYDIVQFRDLQFIDDNSFSVEFVVGNLNSNVIVVFNCSLDINGKIIKGPDKTSS